MLKFKKKTFIYIFLIISFFFPSLLSAKEISLLQERSLFYRKRGLEFQSQGRLDEAMVCYRKAIILDPTFIAAYNDLGVIYEAKGMQEKAEEIYLAGLEVDPNYPNLYTNLAMLCEEKEEYIRAAKYWKKRIELGRPDDVWRKKAEERLVALREFVPELRQEYFMQIAKELAQELATNKRNQRLKELAEINRLYNEAKLLYQNAEYEKALNCVRLALNLNPESKDKAELLSFREELDKLACVAQMERNFQNAMNYYRKDNLPAAKREIDKISAEITPNLKK